MVAELQPGSMREFFGDRVRSDGVARLEMFVNDG